MKRIVYGALCVAVWAACGATNVAVQLEDDGRALLNPDMGWAMHYYDNGARYGTTLAPGDSMDWFPACNVVYLRLPWSWLEPEEGVFNWNAIDTPAQRWIDRGGQISFRVTCSETMPMGATPEWVARAGAKTIRWNWITGPAPDGKFWECVPDDPVYLAKLDRFLAAFAQRYDGRREVAFVDVGSVGIWGEGHTARTIKLSPEQADRIVKIHTELYLKHFKKTHVVMNDDFTFSREQTSPVMDWALAKGLAWRDDSILVGNPNNKKRSENWWYHAAQGRAFSERAPVVLEFGHYGTIKGWGNWNVEKLLESVSVHRASYLSIHGDPRQIFDENTALVEKLARMIGYRFVAREVVYPSVIVAASDPSNAVPFTVRFAFVNGGVAPCYQDAFPCLTLKTAEGGIIAVLADCGFNLKTLEPAAESERAVTKAHEASFVLGRWKAPVVPTGEYYVWLSVGAADGTPVYELPLPGGEGRRYRIGSVQIVDGAE